MCVRGCNANHMWSPLSTNICKLVFSRKFSRKFSHMQPTFLKVSMPEICPDVFQWFQAVDWVPNICSMHHNHIAGLPCQPVVYWNNEAQPQLDNLAQPHRIPTKITKVNSRLSRLTDSKASAAPPVEAHSQTSWYPSQGLGFAVLLFQLHWFWFGLVTDYISLQRI